MKKRNIFYAALFLLTFQLGIAQLAPEEDTTTYQKPSNDSYKDHPQLRGMILGVHGARETMFEIGYFNYYWVESWNEKIKAPPTIGGVGYSLSTEHYINNDYIIAPKAAVWANVFYVNIGCSVPWYFDMENNNSLKVRPEIGFGSGDFKVTYALNMAITNKDMPNISKHMVSAIYFLNFNRKAKDVKLKW